MCFSVYMLGRAQFHGCPSPASSTGCYLWTNILLQSEVAFMPVSQGGTIHPVRPTVDFILT